MKNEESECEGGKKSSKESELWLKRQNDIGYGFIKCGLCWAGEEMFFFICVSKWIKAIKKKYRK